MTEQGLISKNDRSEYREEVQHLTDWCRLNNMSLNVNKTKQQQKRWLWTTVGHTVLSLYIDSSPALDQKTLQCRPHTPLIQTIHPPVV